MDHSQSNERLTWMLPYAITIQVIATLLLGCRLASRATGKSSAGIDDVLVVVAWLFGTAQTVLVLLATQRYGFGQHIWNVPTNLWHKGAMVTWLIQVTFFWSTCFTKISVLLFYRRLVRGMYTRNFKIAVWAAIIFLLVYTITFQIKISLTCRPFEAIWMQYDPTYQKSFTCFSNESQIKTAYLVGSLSVVTDFYSVVLPAWLLMRIKISRRQKVGLAFIFGVGFLLVGVGIARTIFLGQAQAEPIDKSWVAFGVLAASIAESNVAIVCASAPSLRAFFKDFFRDLTVISGSGSKSSRRFGSSGYGRSGLGSHSANSGANSTHSTRILRAGEGAYIVNVKGGVDAMEMDNEFMASNGDPEDGRRAAFAVYRATEVTQEYDDGAVLDDSMSAVPFSRRGSASAEGGTWTGPLVQKKKSSRSRRSSDSRKENIGAGRGRNPLEVPQQSFIWHSDSDDDTLYPLQKPEKAKV